MRKCVLLVCLLISLSALFAQEEPQFYALRENPPLVPIDMRRPGYWISRHPAPDSLLMTAQEIELLNRRNFRQGHVGQILESAPIIQSSYLKRQINTCYSMAKGSGKYLQDGNPTSSAFWQNIRHIQNQDAIKRTQNTRYASPIRYTNQRLIPYSGILTRETLDLEFDRIQNSGFDIGEPIVVYHESRDGKWVFGAGRASSGWFFKEDLAFLTRQEWLKYLQSKDFAVFSADKSDLYLDPSRTNYWGMVRMGTRLPLISEHPGSYELELPNGQQVFCAKNAIHKGFLPYTARNVYELAFSALNAPYGWGDLNAEYDCSGFLKQIFQCFGIYLPRNGTTQYGAGASIHEFSAADNPQFRESIIINKALPAQSFLRMPGHIMLYLGSVEGKAYVIHSLWGISLPRENDKDKVIAANKTLVSDLYLSDGSKNKSLLMRISGIGAISNAK